MTETPEEQEPPSEETVLQRALELGYKRPEDWKGDPPPNGFQSPEEYIERAETFIPILNSRLKKKDTEIESLRSEVQRVARMSDKTIQRQQEQHEAQLQAIRQAKRTAAANGKMDDYDKLDEREREMSEPEAAPGPDERFAQENEWYGNDIEMTNAAFDASMTRAKARPSESLEDNLAFTLQAVKKKFPDRFGEEPTPQEKPVEVEGASLAKPGKRGKGTRISDLSDVEKDMMDRDIRQGIYKNAKEWLEAYDAD